MKKLSLFSSLCAAALLTACSSEEPISNNGAEVSDGNARYLSVNIVSNTGNGTRAEDDDKYENGSATENKVTKVRFYFFDADGKAVNVKADNPGKNWFDWTEKSNEDYGSGVVDPNVERILNATIVISTKEGDALPSQMVAVVNPRAELGEKSFDLNAIRIEQADYATYANGGTILTSDNKEITLSGNHFPMCNSVYADGAEVVKATKITTDNYATTVDAAKNNPVDIYVERNVAKVRTSLDASLNVENGLIQLRSYDKESKTAGEFINFPIYDADGNTTGHQDVYLKLEGWNVTADMNQATLSKRIDTNWKDTELGFIWNNPTFHRSYWALSNLKAVCRYDDYNAAKSKPYYNLNNDEGFTYCNENVVTALSSVNNPSYEDTQNTKVILAGTLCDKTGKALTICEYYGIKFVDDGTQTALKNSVLNYLTDNGYGTKYYKRYVNEEGETVVEKINTTDITFEHVQQDPAADDSYYVRPVLTPEALMCSWFTTDNGAEGTEVKASAINNLLKASQHAKIWNGGMTYYFADIKHFGNKIGVVRNHVYNMNINTIYGLGTPVWDPERKIIPETTTDEDTYIAARINILSWRVVNNDVELKW